jgi:tetratricopeptide (TPR) repeat protein
VAKVKSSVLVLIVIVTLAGNAAGQSAVPAAGLAAEGEGRWADALRVYQEHVERDPAAADTWLRIADIEARLAQPDRAIAALQRAAAARPDNADIFARLSQAYAARGYAASALHAIKGALVLKPRSEDYLRAAATLATWTGDYGTASDAYRELLRTHPQESTLTLSLARVNSWAGNSDAAADAYREYIKVADAESGAWLELARVESWRGNTAGALAALDAYQARFGGGEAYAKERVAVLARGGRPRQALRELDPLIESTPQDPSLNVTRTVALAAARHHGAAVSTLNVVRSAGAEAESRTADSVIRSLLGSSVGPAVTIYDDSDGLRTARVAPKADIGLLSDTRIHAGYEHLDLQAPFGSGLETVSGGTAVMLDQLWAGASQRVRSFWFGGAVGRSRTDFDEVTSYSALVQFTPADSLTVGVERTFGFAAISPRTVSLGLTLLSHRARLDWAPGARYHLGLEGSYDNLSDSNARWTLFVSPRAAVARTQRLNLDLGVLIHQFGVKQDLDHGYYDPRRYEYYSVVAAPYWKASENIGVAMSAGVGPQRDDASRGFTLGMNSSVEATFGIYREWLLKVHGSVTNNRRRDSGAFRGTSGGVVLLRRF